MSRSGSSLSAGPSHGPLSAGRGRRGVRGGLPLREEDRPGAFGHPPRPHCPHPYQAKVKLARKALAARDKGLCGYCGKPGQNIDHIVPRSRGGKNEWTNVVWACMGCNDRKADKLLSEVRMTLRVKPYAPKGKAWLIVAVGTIEPEWEPYLAVTGAVG